MLRLALLLLVCAAVTALAQSAGDGTACVTCHPAESKLHAQTRMAHAMTPWVASGFAQHVPDHPLHESSDGFEFSYSPALTGLQVTAAHGNQTASGIIEWVLGAGAQGQTPLVLAGGSVYESRVSYFPQLNQYGVTIGQPRGRSPNAIAALGRKQSNREAYSCLMCHATEVNQDLEPVIPGVQCERCHAGAAQHAISKGPVTNPGKLAALDQLKLCGTCHRLTPPVDDAQLENVRFQPLRLSKSRCFASGQLACITCHPAHRDAVRNDVSFYNEKCNVCHTAKTALKHTDNRQTGNCIGCHMPVVQLHPALKFTDHFIRVVN